MAERKATIYDVAKYASVSLATVSRIINGNTNVAPETRNRVLNAIKELNYRPNSVAVGLATRKSTMVAVIVPEINYTYISNVVAGLMQQANEYGYDCVLYTTKKSKKEVLNTLSRAIALNPRGIVLFNDSLDDEELEELTQSKIPLVTLGADLENISAVLWHYKDQLSRLVSEALDRNKEVYFVSVEGAGQVEERMLMAIRKAYKEHGREFGNIIYVQDSYHFTYGALKNRLPLMKNPFIVSLRDGIALAAMNAALDIGLKVPEEVEVMAMIGTKYSDLCRPRLSSFDINTKEMGIEGMKVLSRLIEDGNQVITQKLNFEYIRRESTY